MDRRICIILFVIIFTACGHTDPKVVNPANARKGEKLFNTVGCLMCHSVSGETKYGPPLTFSPDREVVVIRNGREVTLKPDRQYILRSLKDPDYEKVKGYQGRKMASIDLSEEELEYITDYLMFINTK